MFWKWFKGLFKRKDETDTSRVEDLMRGLVIGEITKREYVFRGVVPERVTLFSMKLENDEVELLAMLGHQPEPRIGDKVAVSIGNGTIADRTDVHHEKKEDGTVEIIQRKIEWRPIKTYKILPA